MAENTNSDATTSGTQTTGSVAVTDTTKTRDTQNQNVFDTKNIGDDDFSKVFDDPRVFLHPRFKSLNERAKKASEYEAKLNEAEETKLSENKKFEELAAKRAEELSGVKTKYTQTLQDMQIMNAAAKVGVIDLDAVLKLIDRSKISVSDSDNTVLGADEALTTLLDKSPYLKGKAANVTVGSATGPGEESTAGTKKFKLSQLQIPSFWRENEKEIQVALANNQVENDMVK